MWKRLKRLWGKGEGDEPSVEVAGPDVEVAPLPPLPEVVAETLRPPDPIARALEHFDADLAERGPQAVVGALRPLVQSAATDPRVLRRAAEVLRELGDEDLAQGFEIAATSSGGLPLAELAQRFLWMDDPVLALTLGDGAMKRGQSRAGRNEGGVREGRLVGALALARLGQHEAVLNRFEGVVTAGHASPEERLRWLLSANILNDIDALARVDAVGDELADAWMEQVGARARAFPNDREGEGDLQGLLFRLYGTLLLDDAEAGATLSPARLLRWMTALAELTRRWLPEGTRPAWVSPRGEVLARWLAELMGPAISAIPLSARIPRQPVLVMLADDADLAQLCEQRAFEEGALPIFQAVKEPTEFGSPMPDVVGVFRSGVTLPLHALDAERSADRQPPRLVVTDLVNAAKRERAVSSADLAGFMNWAEKRRAHAALAAPPLAAVRPVVDVATPSVTPAAAPDERDSPDAGVVI